MQLKIKKIKTMIDFDKNDCNSVKSIIVKGNTNANVSTRFIKEKMLMFTKVSLKSFFNIIDAFSFPNEEIRAVYDQYEIDKCFLYLNLTKTDSCSMLFVFICKLDCEIKEGESRKKCLKF